MAEETSVRDLTISGNVQDVLTQNVGVTFTPAQLRLVAAGQVVVKRGCIKRLVYQNNSENLTFVLLDPGGGVHASNFKDFRRLFEEAACCGHEILFCYDTKSREISMPHLLPCRCTCDKQG